MRKIILLEVHGSKFLSVSNYNITLYIYFLYEMNTKKRNYQLQLIEEHPDPNKQQPISDQSNLIIDEDEIKSIKAINFDQILSDRIRFGKIQYKSLLMMGMYKSR